MTMSTKQMLATLFEVYGGKLLALLFALNVFFLGGLVVTIRSSEVAVIVLQTKMDSFENNIRATQTLHVEFAKLQTKIEGLEKSVERLQNTK